MVGVGEEERSEQRDDSRQRADKEGEMEEKEVVVRKSEYHAALTTTEEESVGEFRRQLESSPVYKELLSRSWHFKLIERSDRACMRFLIARNQDIPIAVAMCVTAAEWREREGIDAILDIPMLEAIQIDEQAGNEFMHGRDRFGRTIHVEHVGEADPGLCERFDIETIVRAKVHLFEFKKRSVVSPYPLTLPPLPFPLFLPSFPAFCTDTFTFLHPLRTARKTSCSLLHEF
jgi:hypothetical protein